MNKFAIYQLDYVPPKYTLPVGTCVYVKVDSFIGKTFDRAVTVDIREVCPNLFFPMWRLLCKHYRSQDLVLFTVLAHNPSLELWLDLTGSKIIPDLISAIRILGRYRLLQHELDIAHNTVKQFGLDRQQTSPSGDV